MSIIKNQTCQDVKFNLSKAQHMTYGQFGSLRVETVIIDSSRYYVSYATRISAATTPRKTSNAYLRTAFKTMSASFLIPLRKYVEDAGGQAFRRPL